MTTTMTAGLAIGALALMNILLVYEHYKQMRENTRILDALMSVWAHEHFQYCVPDQCSIKAHLEKELDRIGVRLKLI